MKIDEIIDAAKMAAGVQSDSELSKHLGLSRSAVSNWRNGISLPDTVRCERLAGLSGQPLARVLGIVGEARAISREEKSVWRKLAASAATLFVMVAATLPAAHPANASPTNAQADSAAIAHASNRHYAKFRNTLSLLWLWLRWKLTRQPKPSPEHMEAFA